MDPGGDQEDPIKGPPLTIKAAGRTLERAIEQLKQKGAPEKQVLKLVADRYGVDVKVVWLLGKAAA